MATYNITKTCLKENHNHPWVTSGTLVIERCEKFCQFCEGADVHHDWKHAWFLRRHVSTVHCKPGAKYEHVTVADKWTGAPGTKMPKGVRKDGSPKKRPPPRAASSRAAKKRAVRAIHRRDSVSNDEHTTAYPSPPTGNTYMAALPGIIPSIEDSSSSITDMFSDDSDDSLFSAASYTDFAYPAQHQLDFGMMADSNIINTDAGINDITSG